MRKYHRPSTTKALWNRLVKTLPGAVQLRLPTSAQENGAFKAWKGTVRLPTPIKRWTCRPYSSTLATKRLSRTKGDKLSVQVVHFLCGALLLSCPPSPWLEAGIYDRMTNFFFPSFFGRLDPASIPWWLLLPLSCWNPVLPELPAVIVSSCILMNCSLSPSPL